MPKSQIGVDLRFGESTMGKRDKGRSRFRAGRSGGCEAELFEFRDGDPAEPNQLRIAAASFDDAVAYLRQHDPGFRVRCAQSLGVILLVSGTPLD